jgi:hypothetical protein
VKAITPARYRIVETQEELGKQLYLRGPFVSPSHTQCGIDRSTRNAETNEQSSVGSHGRQRGVGCGGLATERPGGSMAVVYFADLVADLRGRGSRGTVAYVVTFVVAVLIWWAFIEGGRRAWAWWRTRD